MTRGDIEAQILKNYIKNNDYINTDELKKLVMAMETPEAPRIETRPYNQSEEVETR